MKTAFISNGGKGGVGKSMSALALTNYLSANPENRVLVIETDTQNPDVMRTLSGTSRENITMMKADLRNEDGWNDFLETLEEVSTDYDYCVVSLPGADIEIQKYLPLIKKIFVGLGIDIVEIFTVNRNQDSLNLFGKSQETGFGQIAIRTAFIMNGAFGERKKFERWDSSPLRKKYKPLEIFMPELFWKTFDLCRESTVTFDEKLEETGISLLHESRLSEWIAAINSEFEKLMAEIEPATEKAATAGVKT